MLIGRTINNSFITRSERRYRILITLYIHSVAAKSRNDVRVDLVERDIRADSFYVYMYV